MFKKYISGKMLIAAMHDEFNIHSRDWESRAPRWIYDNLKTLKISLQVGTKVKDIKFDNYSFELPCNIEVLRDIFINNKRLEETQVTGHKLVNTELSDNGVVDLRYYSIDEGLVTTEIKEGIAQVSYTTLPLTWDEELSMNIPDVPDIPEVIENTKWYMLKIILARGYKHPVYSLTASNSFNNPDIRWKQTIKETKRAARRMTKSDRESIAYTLTEFLSDRDTSINDLISEKYRTNINYNI